MSSSKEVDQYDDDYVVTNLDDGEKYNVDEISNKFNIVKLSNNASESKADGKSKYGEEEVEDENYFDAKQKSLKSGGAKSESSGIYRPVNIPDGGRLLFFRISAVGTTRDNDDKVYSVYYLDVRCNVASPSSWFVYRRYSQFRRLSDVLRSEGYYVPVLPPKQILGTFSVDFVKNRKESLEKWLHALSEMTSSHTGTDNNSNSNNNNNNILQ